MNDRDCHCIAEIHSVPFCGKFLERLLVRGNLFAAVNTASL
jgi:hypothetical protein